MRQVKIDAVVYDRSLLIRNAVTRKTYPN